MNLIAQRKNLILFCLAEEGRAGTTPGKAGEQRPVADFFRPGCTAAWGCGPGILYQARFICLAAGGYYPVYVRVAVAEDLVAARSLPVFHDSAAVYHLRRDRLSAETVCRQVFGADP